MTIKPIHMTDALTWYGRTVNTQNRTRQYEDTMGLRDIVETNGPNDCNLTIYHLYTTVSNITKHFKDLDRTAKRFLNRYRIARTIYTLPEIIEITHRKRPYGISVDDYNEMKNHTHKYMSKQDIFADISKDVVVYGL